jgi:hypothetical protein
VAVENNHHKANAAANGHLPHVFDSSKHIPSEVLNHGFAKSMTTASASASASVSVSVSASASKPGFRPTTATSSSRPASQSKTSSTTSPIQRSQFETVAGKKPLPANKADPIAQTRNDHDNSDQTDHNSLPMDLFVVLGDLVGHKS